MGPIMVYFFFTKEFSSDFKAIKPGINKLTPLKGKESRETGIRNTRKIKANRIGKNTVQHTFINWSKRILGKLALVQIKVNTNTLAFNANDIPCINPSITM